MSGNGDKVELAEKARKAAKQDKEIVFAKVFSGQGTPEQGEKVLAMIKRWCLADQCPAHLANFETNRMIYNTGRQAVWREIEAVINPETQ